jgi:hypothetical protein
VWDQMDYENEYEHDYEYEHEYEDDHHARGLRNLAATTERIEWEPKLMSGAVYPPGG